ncbi:hypothetical protein ACJMK2_013959 [Sinanodonta woodiana]|uniref:YqaJ viral recombinase domain-containing protein n=1 Tax=Sinanodonta woodiana TaxID=1069815 RepID=A0ABD3V138_SINWO
MMEKTTKKVLMNTNYLESLVGDVRERYIQKTAKIQIDPYKLPAEAFSDDRTKWPEISYVDVHFLIFQQSAYTKDQLKNYKSLDEINGVHLLRAKVTHSMRVREKPLEPWVIVATDGSVETAHCTCMAGLGECCTHEATVTDVPAYWMFPPSATFETPYKQIKDMDFHDSEKQAVSNISSPTQNEVILFWDELYQNLPKAAILSVRGKGKFSENFKPKSLFAKWLIDLSQLCLCSKDTTFSDLSYEQVLDKCSATDISVSKEEASYLEKETRGQSNSLFWHRYRVGRITASNLYRVCHTSISQPSLTVLKTICASYGNNKHVNYKLVDSGLIINERYPQFGASPDGMISCDCCGDGCLEIKCPYSTKDKPILDMQMQMFLSDRQYCDFYVWCPNDHHYERIHSKCEMPELLCQYFSRRQVLSPIAVTNKEKMPISTQSDRKYCICGGDDDARKMIMCESENCTKVWFHTSCIKLKHVPKGKW